MGRRGLIGALALAVAAIGFAPTAGSQQTVSGYCEPANTQFDPADVPAGGSTPIPTRGVRERSLRVQGRRVPLLQSGPRTGTEAVVFLHGMLGSSQDWLDLLPRVGRLGVRALAFDLPGFGRAEPAWDFPATFPAYMDWFARALRRLGIERAHFVIHDIGGPIALQWAIDNPGAMQSAVLIDGGVLLNFIPHPIHIAWAAPVVGEAVQLALNRGGFKLGLQQGQLERPLPPTFLDRLYDDQDRETRCAVLRFFGSAIETLGGQPQRQATALKALSPQPPVQVIWGENDPYLMPSMAAAQRRAFPDAEVDLLADTGHWPFADNPEGLRGLAMPFLRLQLR